MIFNKIFQKYYWTEWKLDSSPEILGWSAGLAWASNTVITGSICSCINDFIRVVVHQIHITYLCIYTNKTNIYHLNIISTLWGRKEECQRRNIWEFWCSINKNVRTILLVKVEIHTSQYTLLFRDSAVCQTPVGVACPANQRNSGGHR